MKPLTLRRTLVPLVAGLLVSLLPFQIGLAQTNYSQHTTSIGASANATAIVSTDLQSEGHTSDAKLADSEWKRDWEQRMNNWGRDWDQQTNSWYDRDAEQNDWNSRNQLDAEIAIEDATGVISDFKADIKQMQRDGVHKDELRDARKILSSAKKELNDARRAYRKQNFREALERAEHAVELIEEWNDIDQTDNRDRRQAAVDAIEDAESAIADYKAYIKDWRRDGASNGELKEAKLLLSQAKKELSEAKRPFSQRKYVEARAAAEEVVDTIDDRDGNGDTDDIDQSCRLTDSQLATVANFPPKNGPIVAFGDSLTAGVGSTRGNNYVNQLEELVDEDIINAGVSGDTTEEALARLEEDVLSHDPRAVIVWLGGNDHLARYYEEIRERADDNSFWEKVLASVFRLFGKEPGSSEVLTETETFENIETIVQRIQATGAVTIIVGIDGQPLDKNLSRRYKQVAKDTDSIFVSDVLSGIIGRPGRTSNDLIHPNNTGYELVAERIFPAVVCVVETNH